MATVIFPGSPLSRRKVSCNAQHLAGSGDWETGLLCEDWELERGEQSCKLTVNTTASINTGRGKGVYYITQENKFRLEMGGGFLTVMEVRF